MDSVASYRGGNTKPLNKNEIEKMKKIMRRVPIIKEKNDEYHKKESLEADELFNKELKKIN